MALEVVQFPYRTDNYGFLIHDPDSGETACVDAGSENADAECATLEAKGWTLTQIWVTHHHFDHVEGLDTLKAKTGCKVFGPAESKTPIPGIDVGLRGGERFEFAGHTVEVLATPGHTLDMLNYYVPGAGLLFSGDTLFAMGCGRLFEGTPAQMHNSMGKLKALPGETTVYCAHEYSAANAAFALTIEPENQALKNRASKVEALRAQGLSTVPTSIQAERDTNPYFRCDQPVIRARLGMDNASDEEVFAEIRRRKDAF